MTLCGRVRVCVFSVSSCLFLCVFCGFWPRTEALTVSLDGKWSLSSSNGSVSLPALVPGGVHTALLQQQLIQVSFTGLYLVISPPSCLCVPVIILVLFKFVQVTSEQTVTQQVFQLWHYEWTWNRISAFNNHWRETGCDIKQENIQVYD